MRRSLAPVRRGQDDTFRYGWAAGVGAEYQWGNWSLSLDYIHYDLGRFNFAYSDGVSPDFLVASTQFSGDMIRGAINYRFDWTPLDLLLGRRPSDWGCWLQSVASRDIHCCADKFTVRWENPC